jgi:hypothetical protein
MVHSHFATLCDNDYGGIYALIIVILAGERAQRERLRDLAVFERLDGNPRKTSPDLAVKKVRSLCLSLKMLILSSVNMHLHALMAFLWIGFGCVRLIDYRLSQHLN